MLEAVSIATGEFIAGLISDAWADRRRGRREAIGDLRQLAAAVKIAPELAAAVQAWIDRPDVIAQLATATTSSLEQVIAAVIEPLRFELRAAVGDVDSGAAEQIVRNVLEHPTLLDAGTPAARRRILDGLEDLRAGQGLIYNELLETTLTRLHHAKREGNAALVACQYGDAARWFELEADEAKRLGASGLEAAALAMAVTSLANELFRRSTDIEGERVRRRMHELTLRREPLVAEGPPRWRLAALMSEIDKDEAGAVALLERIMDSGDATGRDRADAWCRLMNMAGRANDRQRLEGLLAERPPDPDQAEVALVMANVEIRALDTLGRAALSDVERYLGRIDHAVQADPDLADRALLDLTELRFDGAPSAGIQRALHEQTLALAQSLGHELVTVGALLGLASLDASDGNSALVVERIADAKTSLARASAAQPTPLPVLGQVFLQIGQVLLADYATNQVDDRESPVLTEAVTSLRTAQGYAVEANAPSQVVAEIELHIGRAEVLRGHLAEALAHHSEAAKNPIFEPSARMMQAEVLLALGRWEEARELAVTVIAHAGNQPVSDFARRLVGHIDSDVQPLLQWYDSPDAQALALEAASTSGRAVVARLTRELLDLWSSQQGDGAEAFLLDYWARGNFVRLAHALSVSGSDSIAIDASTADEIRTACRILCPLFETVVIKWCGEVHTGMAIGTIPEDYAGPGGHGFMLSGGLQVAPNVPGGTPGAVMLSPNCSRLPADVIDLLKGDANGLYAAGRLVVAPAGLIGCHSAAAGWNDGILVDRLLGGAVLATGSTAPSNLDRVLELGTTAIPYAAHVPLDDLDVLLTEMEQQLLPFRLRVFELLGQGRLGSTHWADQKSVRLEVDVAFRDLDAAFQREIHGKGEASQTQSVLTATSSAEPMTATINSSASILSATRPSSGSWFPLWRLSGDDGVAWSRTRHWSSTAGSEGARATWLCPGTHGFSAPVVIG